MAMLEAVDERLSSHYRLDAVRAHLLEMIGDREAARLIVETTRDA
jgi:predicted RNA polymerase sigma factor